MQLLKVTFLEIFTGMRKYNIMLRKKSEHKEYALLLFITYHIQMAKSLAGNKYFKKILKDVWMMGL